VKSPLKKPSRWPSSRGRFIPGRYYAPDVNICEFNDSLKLWADMPGVKEKDVNVTLKDGVLTIIGQIATDTHAGLRPMYAEYNVGSYYRE
jgi:HSP20 family protein